MAVKTKKKKKSTAVKGKKAVSNKKTNQKRAQKKKQNAKLSSKAVRRLIVSVAAIIAIIAAVALISSHTSGRSAGTVKAPDKDIAWGIDVSSHNGEIDWEEVSENADFAFVRVGYRGYTEGEINADKLYKDNLKGANKHKVPVGVYFYSQAVSDDEAEEEAEFVLDCIKGYDISLPVVIDFEYAYKNGAHLGRLWDAGLDNKARTSLINAFCAKIRKAGYTPAIYASTYIYESQLNLKSIDDDVFIWVADYNSDITYAGYYDIWQYSETGSCGGVHSKNVDTNYWYIKNRL